MIKTVSLAVISPTCENVLISNYSNSFQHMQFLEGSQRFFFKLLPVISLSGCCSPLAA